MKKFLSFAISGVILMPLFTGCSKLVATKADKNVQYVVQFSGNDFNVGNVVTTEMPIDKNNPDMKSFVLNKALTDHKCDAILLPRYEIISKTFGKDIIRITGRAATFKSK